ncbi:uncharacterized protein [Palaemon carinicauda]|uniref:uncharacterized protein isoform X4 n=1 Tax=Palaemon carinicauda TaxID=392227 RepID=UPI0035B611E4
MMYCKFLMFAMLVGTALGVARPWPLASRPAQGICDHWCGTPPNLVCCDKKCPVDNRKPGDCNRPLAAAASGSISGPRPCSRDLDCHAGALCCWDSCLQYKKCTNV